MIAAMPDFARIDRELAAIGTVPEAVQPLLDQYGQRDRSLENVDLVLDALREGREPSSSPPGPVVERPSFLPLGWDADRKSDPGLEAAPLLAVEREEITVTTGAPDAMFDETPVVPQARDNDYAAAMIESDLPPSASPLGDDVSAGEEPIDTQQASPPPPAEESPAPEPEPEPQPEPQPEWQPESQLPEPRSVLRSSRPPRPDLQALLDAELDPREFPSTNPPPARMMRSSLPPSASPVPPLPRTSLPPVVDPNEPAADFELLVDDDDILEIDEESE